MRNFKINYYLKSKYLVLTLLIIFPFLVTEASADINFKDSTNTSGILPTNQSFGAAWVDFNNDGFQDLWSGNHFEKPNLYLNNGDGTFTDIFDELDLKCLKCTENFLHLYDMHVGTWTDFDNNGLQDLLILAGAESGKGEQANLFFINNNGTLEESAKEKNLDYPLGRGRTPLWFDWNRDGFLDVILSNLNRPDGKAPTTLFVNTQTGFENFAPEGLEIQKYTGYMPVPNPNEKNKPYVFFVTPYDEGIYNLSNFPIDIVNLLKLRSPQSVDLAIADFNGDQLLDIFQTITNLNSYVFQSNLTKIYSNLLIRNPSEQGFSFQSNGTVAFEFFPQTGSIINVSEVYIGSKKIIPSTSFFELNSENIQNWGVSNYTSGIDKGLFISFNPQKQTWNVNLSSPERSRYEFSIQTEIPISNLTQFGINPDLVFSKDKLFFQNKTSLKDVTSLSGLNLPTSCYSVGAGDFDNDMDVDLYLECTLSIYNLNNILYENLGNGKFNLVKNAGGAIGTNNGVGDSVSIVDYNNDGFLDIFITNGGYRSTFSNLGSSQLFKNEGNDNHWIEINLEGTTSNHDGIGSTVFVTSGNITQIRQQTGGFHYRSQDSQVLHFGLGLNNLVEKITIFWPSGSIQQMKNISADQILYIIEENNIGSPKNQTLSGTEPADVLCRSDLFLIIKTSNNEPACVKLTTAEKLIERNWGTFSN